MHKEKQHSVYRRNTCLGNERENFCFETKCKADGEIFIREDF